jgi:hypothetical protein
MCDCAQPPPALSLAGPAGSSLESDWMALSAEWTQLKNAERSPRQLEFNMNEAFSYLMLRSYASGAAHRSGSAGGSGPGASSSGSAGSGASSVSGSIGGGGGGTGPVGGLSISPSSLRMVPFLTRLARHVQDLILLPVPVPVPVQASATHPVPTNSSGSDASVAGVSAHQAATDDANPSRSQYARQQSDDLISSSSLHMRHASGVFGPAAPSSGSFSSSSSSSSSSNAFSASGTFHTPQHTTTFHLPTGLAALRHVWTASLWVPLRALLDAQSDEAMAMMKVRARPRCQRDGGRCKSLAAIQIAEVFFTKSSFDFHIHVKKLSRVKYQLFFLSGNCQFIV